MAFDTSFLRSALSPLENNNNQLKSPSTSEYSIVFINLEATGLKPNCEIIQISAKSGNNVFNEYIHPKNGISDYIKGLTGLYIMGNQMYSRAGEVAGVSKEIGCNNFINFLESLEGKVIIAAHNCFNFAGPVLAGMAVDSNMIERFQAIVAGFSDTVPLFIKRLPGRNTRGKNYRLVPMAKEFLGELSSSPDCEKKVDYLIRLAEHEKSCLKDEDIIRSRRSLETMREKYIRNVKEYQRAPGSWKDWY